MVSIGRGSGPRVPRPNNTGLGQRANAQLEAAATAQAQRYTTSLRVDGTPVYFWHKAGGSIPCSCSAAPQSNANAQVEDINTTDYNAVQAHTSVGDSNELSQSRYKPSGNQRLNDFLAPAVPHQTVPERLNQPARPTTPQGIEDFDDLDNALERMEEPVQNGPTDFDDPFNLFNGKVLECPICLGTGYIDSWQLYGGARIVFDTSAEHNFSCTGVVDDSRNPTAITLRTGNRARWTYRMPRTWLTMLRCELYNRTTPIPSDAYTWTWTDADGQTDSVTPPSLDTLRDTGTVVTLYLDAVRTFEFTHAEWIWTYTPPLFAQFPEVSQAYEEEFLDWNVTLSVELPLLDLIKEGDYVTDGRYGKVWKLSTLTRKATAGGTLFGLSGDARVLTPLEQLANQLNLFDAQTVRTPVLTNDSRPVPVVSDDPQWQKIDW